MTGDSNLDLFSQSSDWLMKARNGIPRHPYSLVPASVCSCTARKFRPRIALAAADPGASRGAAHATEMVGRHDRDGS
jgi:hypothetical protein